MKTDRVKDWWKKYYAEDFLLVEGMASEKGTLKSTDYIEAKLNLPKGSSILDLGCGYGRIAIKLARRGYRVTGLD